MLPTEALNSLLPGTKPDVDQPVATVILGCGMALSPQEQPQAAYARAWKAGLQTWAVGDYTAMSAGFSYPTLKTAALLDRVRQKKDTCRIGDVIETVDAGPGTEAYCLRRLTLQGDERTECVVFAGRDVPGHTLFAALAYQDAETTKAKAGLLQLLPRVTDQLARS
ncbi:hypothetical protein [Longispora fulva]|uniref:Uncharacterized protein n=1 Tax=Longispora fulva TaxID=619741 RepID=A0A8J7GKF4_9ACTN|nr:hypothetical protein [Longispora fulva]MBG6138472.1 hypothetical protein [Longispora fulva]